MKLLTIGITSLSLAAACSTATADSNGKITGNEFNPAISLILDGRYSKIDESELKLPGFALGGEAGLPGKGFTTGHNELVMSANIDDKFYGTLHAALEYGEGETSIELEEAFVESLNLGSGFAVKGGRFYSGIGYLNSVHEHAHDFSDRPLVYDALLGGALADTGVQARWVAPIDQFVSLGTEVTSGNSFPSGDNENGNKGLALFAKTGGDIGASSSWLLGASYYQSKFDVREAGGHGHGGEEVTADNELLDGKVDVAGVDVVVKWAPNGNSKGNNFKLQAEYFVKNEEGKAEFTEDDPTTVPVESANADYAGKQQGYYVQGVYQFMPAWRVGLRYDALSANNRVSNFVDNGIDETKFLAESGYGTAPKDPSKGTVMIDYTPNHFSRVRLQYSQLDNGQYKVNNMIGLQYIMSLGAHGAHAF